MFNAFKQKGKFIMRKLKKLVASVAALATAAAMSVGTLAVTANEVTKDLISKKAYTVAEEQFIASYEKDGVSDVAKYLMDNSVDLNDAQLIVEMYLDAKNSTSAASEQKDSKKKAVRAAEKPNFYSKSNISDFQHYGVVLSKKGNYSRNDVTWHIIYNQANTHYYVDAPTLLDIRSLDPGVNVIGDGEFGFGGWIVTGPTHLSSNANTSVAVCDFPFGIKNNVPSEYALYQEFYFQDQTDGTDPVIMNKTPLIYSTYVQGDVNRDGIVDKLDLQWIVDYNMRKNPDFFHNFSFTGSKTLTNAQMDIIELLAADADHNGEIGVADMVWMAHHGIKLNQ